MASLLVNLLYSALMYKMNRTEVGRWCMKMMKKIPALIWDVYVCLLKDILYKHYCGTALSRLILSCRDITMACAFFMSMKNCLLFPQDCFSSETRHIFHHILCLLLSAAASAYMPCFTKNNEPSLLILCSFSKSKSLQQ